MPAFVLRAKGGLEAALAEPMIEIVGRGCALQKYKPIAVPAIDVQEEIIAYASPDSTYAVTKRLIDAAKKTIQIGIYDFTAEYMKALLLNAMARGVKVTLMLDIDSDGERTLFDKLVEMGVEGVAAPSCANPDIQFFSSCHEKFIVIDSTWTLVQSGNYSNNSIPLNEKDGGDPSNFVKGNRDTGLAVKSTKLANFFSKVLRSDIALTLTGPQSLGLVAPTRQDAFLIEAVPKNLPTRLFPSKTFTLSSPLSAQPVLSPDNYMSTIPGVLRGARKSVLIEQQYIKGSQTEIGVLLSAIMKARADNPKLDVRIVLGKVFGDGAEEKKNIALIARTYGLKLAENIRFIDTSRFVHCHNKMIIVDGKQVLISSQNWSDTAVTKNREAGLLLTHSGIAKYFTEIFESDWETAFQVVPKTGAQRAEAESLKLGGFVQVVAADYRVV